MRMQIFRYRKMNNSLNMKRDVPVNGQQLIKDGIQYGLLKITFQKYRQLHNVFDYFFPRLNVKSQRSEVIILCLNLQ